MPQGRFGNLIALPLQKAARKQDNTVFRDSAFVPWADQWAFLASVRKIGRPQVEQIVEDAERRGRILGGRLPPQDDEETEPWTARDRLKAQTSKQTFELGGIRDLDPAAKVVPRPCPSP